MVVDGLRILLELLEVLEKKIVFEDFFLVVHVVTAAFVPLFFIGLDFSARCVFFFAFSKTRMPAFFMACLTSPVDASSWMSRIFPRGSRWLRLHLLRLVFPSIRTKLFSRCFRMTQYCPASLPAIFMQTVPMSMVSSLLVRS